MSLDPAPLLHAFDSVTITPLFDCSGSSVDMLRLDSIDPVISGNKWFKLKYNLYEAFRQGYRGIMSFGGRYSNHLHALAGAGSRLRFPAIGFVRCQGGQLPDPLNDTLIDCKRWGMMLEPLTYGEYRGRYSADFCADLRAEYPGYFLVPEGGSNVAGVRGVAETLQQLELQNYDYVVCPVGSGGTLAGVVAAVAGLESQPVGSASEKPTVVGVSALKGLAGKLERTVSELLAAYAVENAVLLSCDRRWRILHEFHCGGFGKVSQSLMAFKESFQARHGIELEPVYTAKMMYAVCELLDRQYFAPCCRILVVHTGGLQGNRGLNLWSGIQSDEQSE
ncbi:MAG: hypothetical protein CSA50_04630 [Gammaproteobacteria bacterium]|nr:MAG: hypothetical protein CSA50_04630 [Gammaproteobacteria bacterium]